jgi:hypothetical protein
MSVCLSICLSVRLYVGTDQSEALATHAHNIVGHPRSTNSHQAILFLKNIYYLIHELYQVWLGMEETGVGVEREPDATVHSQRFEAPGLRFGVTMESPVSSTPDGDRRRDGKEQTKRTGEIKSCVGILYFSQSLHEAGIAPVRRKPLLSTHGNPFLSFVFLATVRPRSL